MNAYLECPTIKTKSFTIRLIRKADSESLFQCYNDERAVCLMNDDNCDFGFYVKSRETILDKGIMPSEKVLDFPVDCNTLTGSVNL